jgi:hypothetical protein
MRAKKSFQKLGLVAGLAIVLALAMSITAYAQAAEPVVELFRLGGTQVGVKITFPTDISGDFLGMLAGKALDCDTIAPNIVYCTGPFQKGKGASTLYLVNLDTKEIVLRQVLSSMVMKAPAEVDWSTFGSSSPPPCVCPPSGP